MPSSAAHCLSVTECTCAAEQGFGPNVLVLFCCVSAHIMIVSMSVIVIAIGVLPSRGIRVVATSSVLLVLGLVRFPMPHPPSPPPKVMIVSLTRSHVDCARDLGQRGGVTSYVT